MSSKPTRKKSKRVVLKVAIILVLLICIGIAALFGFKIWTTNQEYRQGDEVYDKIAEIAKTEAEPENDPAPAVLKEVEVMEEDHELDNVPAVDFETLQSEVNENIIAWIYSPDTVIDYPVVQGMDNDYYLRHLADGTYNLNGCLFIDYRNDPNLLDRNTYIYGHHMQSGKMFASIVRYSEQDYYEEHKVIYLSMGEHVYRLEPFSGYTTEKNSDAYEIDFNDDHAYAMWLREVVNKSEFIPDEMTINTKDRIVTLSTCAYLFYDARYVLYCKVVKIK